MYFITLPFMADAAAFWLQHSQRPEYRIEQRDTHRGFVVLYLYLASLVGRSFTFEDRSPIPCWFPELQPHEVEA